MEAEGMVHALEEIKRLLKPNGFLVDIHPIREEPLIQIYHGRKLLFSESDPGYDYDESLQHADKALDEVIQRGSFHIEGKAEFELFTYGSSAAEMQGYWAKYGAFDDDPKDDAITTRQYVILKSKPPSFFLLKVVDPSIRTKCPNFRGGRWVSNPQPSEPQSEALPLSYAHQACLHNHSVALCH
jgi:hypothetical protein